MITFINKKKIQYLLIAVVLALAMLAVKTIRAQGDSATTVINTINQLRAQRGLSALEPHPALMQIAQQHSQYQASIGTWTHFSADGSRPKDRAIAAGFGNGATIYISENVAFGADMSIMETINGPWNDPEHHHTMYNSSAKYIGAGVAYSGNLVFYTVDTGYWVGDPAPTPEPGDIETPTTPNASLIPSAVPVIISTPLPDGSVKHIVQGGQTLWTIAAVYNIPLEELREINGLESDTILVLGDEVLIHPAYTPTNTPIGEPSPTLPQRFTHTPSPIGFQGTPVGFTPSSPSPTQTAFIEPRFRTTSKNPTIVILAVIISGGTLLSALYFSVRKKD